MSGDLADRVTGAAEFVADVSVPGALHASFVYAGVPRARITKVVLDHARRTPGFVDAITGSDVGMIRLGRALQDYPILAVDEVLFPGQRVAAVAGEDFESSRAAASRVAVEYELLPESLDANASLAAGGVVLHPGYESYGGAVTGRSHPNLQGMSESSDGDFLGAFAAADQVFEATFTCARSHSAPLEAHACIVWASGRSVEVWSTNKEPYNLRRLLSLVGDIAPEDITVHLRPLGGDFGSKGFPYIEAACYLMSLRTGRPVRSRMTYTEELTTTASRHPTQIRLRTAVGGGRLVGVDMHAIMDGGAFGGLKASPRAVVHVNGAALSSYSLVGRRDRSYSVYSNALPGGHVRAPGEVQALFAGESHVDMIARTLGVDPVDFRLANARDSRVRNVVAGIKECLGKWEPTRIVGSGVGVAVSFRDTGPGRTTVLCIVEEGRGVEVALTVPDQGAGSYEVFRQLAAGALNIPSSAVRISAMPVGYDARLEDAGAGASRVSVVAGRAVVDGCHALLAKLGDAPTEPSPAYWIDERLASVGSARLEAVGSASASFPSVSGLDTRSHAAVAVDLSVDRETGEITVHRAALVVDAGLVINPVGHRGQLEGGFIFGLSQALYEELIVQAGHVVTPNLGDYRIATTLDVPPLEIRTILPNSSLDSAPILSVGELINVAVAPAIANAIYDATSARVYELPITPERVVRALQCRS